MPTLFIIPPSLKGTILHNLQKFVKVLPLTFRKRLPREVKIVAIPKKEAKRINQKYRNKSKPPNVLSFRYGKDYGEILVCPEVIRDESKEQMNTYKYQMTWMIIHGILHLASMHHEDSKKTAEEFAKLERSILDKVIWKEKFKIQSAKFKI